MPTPSPTRVIWMKLATRALPAQAPFATSEFMGSGEPCDACDDVILSSSTERLCIFAFHPALRFHIECFWEWERQRRGRVSDRSRAGSQ
jgi:hypothetical protein